MSEVTNAQVTEEDEEEIEIEELPSYPDNAPSIDEQRRAFVLAHLASPDIDAKILIEGMEIALRWLRDGTVPTRDDKPRRSVAALKST